MPAARAISFDEVKPVLLGTGQSYLRRLMREHGLTVTALASPMGAKDTSRPWLTEPAGGGVASNRYNL